MIRFWKLNVDCLIIYQIIFQILVNWIFIQILNKKKWFIYFLVILIFFCAITYLFLSWALNDIGVLLVTCFWLRKELFALKLTCLSFEMWSFLPTLQNFGLGYSYKYWIRFYIMRKLYKYVSSVTFILIQVIIVSFTQLVCLILSEWVNGLLVRSYIYFFYIAASILKRDL